MHPIWKVGIVLVMTTIIITGFWYRYEVIVAEKHQVVRKWMQLYDGVIVQTRMKDECAQPIVECLATPSSEWITEILLGPADYRYLICTYTFIGDPNREVIALFTARLKC